MKTAFIFAIISFFLGVGCYFVGAAFKIMHWPGGALGINLAYIFSGLSLILVLIGIIKSRKVKKEDD